MKNILLIFDVACQQDCSVKLSSMIGEEWETERNIYNTLKKQGYYVTLFPIYNNIKELISFLIKNPKITIFNLCESINNNRDFESALISVCKLLNIKISGCSSKVIDLCKDKSITKSSLGFYGFKVPKFFVYKQGEHFSIKKSLHLNYPLIIKPLNLDGSEGIDQNSVVNDAFSLKRKFNILKRKFNTDLVVEEFIPGREFFISCMGPRRNLIFKPRELLTSNVKNKNFVYSYKAKWNIDYRNRNKVKTRFVNDPILEDKLKDYALNVYNTLNLDSYIRIDCKLTADGDIYLIEVNPNPGLGKFDEFAQSAKGSGISYSNLLNNILKNAA